MLQPQAIYVCVCAPSSANFQVELACRMPMAWLGKLWDRAQGKWHVERICEKVYDECLESDKENLKVDKLPIATLLVYNSVNKQLLNPHKEPPPMSKIYEKMEEYGHKTSGKGILPDTTISMHATEEVVSTHVEKTIDREQFKAIIMEWIRTDLKVVLANRAVLAFLAAPALAMATKRATKDVPHVGKAVEKVPTPLLFTVFSVGLVLLQDFRVG